MFAPQAWKDYFRWQRVDRSLVKRINLLIDDASRDPFAGIGKPERLKYGLADAWSRRITEERRPTRPECRRCRPGSADEGLDFGDGQRGGGGLVERAG